MSWDSIINSRVGTSVLLGLAKSMQPRTGNRLANKVADKISARKTLKIVRATRANQWVVTGEKLNKEELDVVVRETFREQPAYFRPLPQSLQLQSHSGKSIPQP
jgi:hypothetical protein